MYEKHFKKAIERTKSLNLGNPLVKFDNRNYITQEMLEKYPYIMRDEFGEFEIEDIAFQCLSVNLKLKEFISEQFNCPVYYTIGYIDFKDSKMFYQSEESLKDMLKKENNTGEVSLHAWLTFPSMEIIDSTILTSMSLKNNIPEGLGGIIATNADKVKHMKFIPMLVGEEFIFEAGLVREIAFAF